MAYLPILTYHRILRDAPTRINDPHRIAVSEKQFRQHVMALKHLGYKAVGLQDYGRRLIEGKAHPEKTVAITFDDGYEEMLTVALPILQKIGFTATVFAVPGQLGGHNAWDRGDAKLLSGNQYRLLLQAGWTIGGHTCSHVHLPNIKPELAQAEIVNSKKQLEDLLASPITTFAYPYGESNEAVEAMVKAAGYEAGFATDRASARHETNLFRIRRVVIFPKTNLWQLLWKAQRWYPAYQDWKVRRSRPEGERRRRENAQVDSGQRRRADEG